MSSLDASKAQISHKQTPVVKDGRLNLESFLVVQSRQNRSCSKLLDAIDELDRRLAAGIGHRRTQLQARSEAAQEFAKVLDANPSPLREICFATDDGRYVFIVFEVKGNPSHTSLKQAEEWMAARGQTWTKNSKRLRAEVLKALRNGDELPSGHFGFRVERTIRIVDELTEGFHAELPNSFR
ncbi:hypothetical protein J6524_11245 [Bradyrhizobium sp. WSM 1738]|uniref:hypothetical protein n=1 Tax=Bradyrhizobium hereditatis TaxID=2821405 RepID=UPI001CE299FF|nr:hypothetical protein [Bradyrhizobium hereditatis]MCA6115467.1 hypothetical protein [Bradyrhizobium hereditatis]